MRIGRLAAVALVIAGCSAAPAAPMYDAPAAASPTDLATEAPVAASIAAPTAKPNPTQKATYYTPPGWDGSSDVDCKDFKTHPQAVSFFRGTGGSKTNDPYGLDGEHDGNPCETLP